MMRILTAMTNASEPAPAPAPRRRFRATALVVAVLVLVGPGLAGCGGDDSSSSGEAGVTTTSTGTAEPGTAEPPDEETLRVLVTNDDGYEAEGIDTVVEALGELTAVEVNVVAPLEGKSGSGGTFTEGPVDTSEVETASGVEAIAVDGFPADAVRVAIDEMDLDPHLVVSGINEGQNVGPLVDISGTIGGARAGVARDVPALALSAGLPSDDYEPTAEFMVEWITERRDALVSGDAPLQVESINVPACEEGEVRGLEEVPPGDGGGQNPLDPAECTSTPEDPPDDVTAFLNGFAALSIVPDEPATPPQPAPAE